MGDAATIPKPVEMSTTSLAAFEKFKAAWDAYVKAYDGAGRWKGAFSSVTLGRNNVVKKWNEFVKTVNNAALSDDVLRDLAQVYAYLYCGSPASKALLTSSTKLDKEIQKIIGPKQAEQFAQIMSNWVAKLEDAGTKQASVQMATIYRAMGASPKYMLDPFTALEQARKAANAEGSDQSKIAKELNIERTLRVLNLISLDPAYRGLGDPVLIFQEMTKQFQVLKTSSGASGPRALKPADLDNDYLILLDIRPGKPRTLMVVPDGAVYVTLVPIPILDEKTNAPTGKYEIDTSKTANDLRTSLLKDYAYHLKKSMGTTKITINGESKTGAEWALILEAEVKKGNQENLANALYQLFTSPSNIAYYGGGPTPSEVQAGT